MKLNDYGIVPDSWLCYSMGSLIGAGRLEFVLGRIATGWPSSGHLLFTYNSNQLRCEFTKHDSNRTIVLKNVTQRYKILGQDEIVTPKSVRLSVQSVVNNYSIKLGYGFL